MTTVRDDLKDRQLRFGTGYTETQGTEANGFSDPSSAYPRSEYGGEPNVNKAARGGAQHTLKTGSGIQLPPGASSQYTLADIKETQSGHVLEFNDTPAGERILIKHANGSGVEFRPDGTILIVSSHNKVEVTHGDNKVVVEGDADLTYKGNLTMNVTGDFEVNCNNYNVNARGNKTENIDGSLRTKVFGNVGHTVSGNYSQTVVGSSIDTRLGNYTEAVKGAYKQAVEGDMTIASSGVLTQTAESRMNQSAPDVNIAATNLSVFGDNGTIGGENIIMYNYNMHTGHTVWSETMNTNVVYGDLEGTARRAVTADVTNSQNYADPDPGGGTGSAQGYSVDGTARDTTATALPTNSLLSSYLTQSDNGVKKVKIDIDSHLANSLKVRPLKPTEVRSKLRDDANLNNAEFTAAQIGAGNLSPSYNASTPPGGYGRVRSAGGSCQRGSAPVGNATAERSTKTFRVEEPRKVFTLSASNRIESESVTSRTRINGGFKLARFLGANDAGNFNDLSEVDKKNIARNYYAHMELTKSIIGVRGKYANHKLDVVEGYYAKELYGLGGPGGVEEETLTPGGLLDLRNKGRVVVYEIINENGEMDPDATFDVATDLAEVGMFDKLILDYDTFNADGSMNVQLIVEIPQINSDYKVTYKQEVETRFNNKLQASDSLVEIEPDPRNPRFSS